MFVSFSWVFISSVLFDFQPPRVLFFSFFFYFYCVNKNGIYNYSQSFFLCTDDTISEWLLVLFCVDSDLYNFPSLKFVSLVDFQLLDIVGLRKLTFLQKRNFPFFFVSENNVVFILKAKIAFLNIENNCLYLEKCFARLFIFWKKGNISF